MINLRRTLSLARDVLRANSISHALIGGFALATYGLQRATYDIDLLADGEQKNLIKLKMLEQGFTLKFESSEVLQFTGMGFLDILLANRPLSREMLSRAELNNDLEILVLRAEDLIGLKIQAYKNDPSRELQDKADIQKLLNNPDLDLNEVKKYADIFDEWDVLQKLRLKP